MARLKYSDLEKWMLENGLRPADAARAFDVSSQRFNGWRKRGQVSADATDMVLARMRELGKVDEAQNLSPSTTEVGQDKMEHLKTLSQRATPRTRRTIAKIVQAERDGRLDERLLDIIDDLIERDRERAAS